MKARLAVSICVVCSGLIATCFAAAAPAISHPHAIATTLRIRPLKLPVTNFRVRPIGASGPLLLSGTAPDGLYHGAPALLGRLAKPGAASPALLSGTRINRKP